MWNCPYSNDSFPSYAEDIDAGSSPSAAALAEAAQGHAVTLVGGSIPERSNGKLYNTCLVYSKEGRLLAKHRKVRCHCCMCIPLNMMCSECHPFPFAAGLVHAAQAPAA